VSAGRLLHRTFRGLLSVYSRYGLHARQVAFATLYTGGFSGFVTSAAAPIATGRSDLVPGWDLHPLLTSVFHGAQHSSTRALEGKDILANQSQLQNFVRINCKFKCVRSTELQWGRSSGRQSFLRRCSTSEVARERSRPDLALRIR
jgi:hypothetical protein